LFVLGQVGSASGHSPRCARPPVRLVQIASSSTAL
jgi:hypothetical protein